MEVFKELKGVVEITGYKNGKKFYYDKGDNTVTIWAKHSMIHLLTGEVMTSHGKQREFTGHSLTENLDGTLISGEQFFTNYDSNAYPSGYNLDRRWSRNTANFDATSGDINHAMSGSDNLMFPFFPTKMLLGTGFEYEAWNDISASDPNDRAYYESYGYNDANFGNPTSEYSDTWNGTNLVATKTMNDTIDRVLTENVSTEDFAIKGAIKNGGYVNTSETSKIIVQDDTQYLDYNYRGIGKPCFIYCKRDNRFFSSATEIGVNSDDNKIENKITFTVNLPEQTGSPKDFYPYNGYMLKEIGLFNDARIVDNNSTPVSGDYLNEYRKMSNGILFSKRRISPIFKSPDVSLDIKWTLYL